MDPPPAEHSSTPLAFGPGPGLKAQAQPLVCLELTWGLRLTPILRFSCLTWEVGTLDLTS